MGCAESGPEQIQPPTAKLVTANRPPAGLQESVSRPPAVIHVLPPRQVTVSDYEYSYTDSEV
jgi:hypothetical protein